MRPDSSIKPLRKALDDPRCPFDSEKQVYNTLARARPIIDSAGRVVDPGDPELLSCFIRLAGTTNGPLFLDLERLARLMDKRRLAQAAA